MRIRHALAACLAVSSIAVAPTDAEAREQVTQFLERLRESQMHDVSIWYLESLRARPQLPQEIAVKLAYEEGLSHLGAARATLDFPRREQHLDTARAKFRQFIANEPRHHKVPAARAQLGNILVEQAKSRLAQSKQPSRAKQKEALIREAREMFEEAEREIHTAIKALEQVLEAYPKVIDPKVNLAQFEERRERREDYLELRMAQAALAYEAARAYPDGSPERKERLELAASRYEAIHDRWRVLVISIVARRERGRCLQELGQRKQAISAYAEVLALDDVDELFEVRAETLALCMSCWRHPEEKLAAESVLAGRRWLEANSADRLKTRYALAIRWELAQALEVAAAQATDRSERAKLRREACEQAAPVAASLRSEHQPAAAAYLRQREAAEIAPPKGKERL